MAHDVFISHATSDKAVSDAICAALEGAGIRCWIAPRDVQPGRPFAGEINRAIQHSRVMVLVCSGHSNNSDQVLREVQLAVNAHLHIIQFRIEDVRLNDDLGYYLSTPHWLDALTPPLESHMARLKTSIKALLVSPAGEVAATQAPTETQTPAPVAQSLRPASPPSFEQREVAPGPHQPQVSTAGEVLRPPETRGRKVALAGAIIALVAAGILCGWWFGLAQPAASPRPQAAMTNESLAAQPAATPRPQAAKTNKSFVGVFVGEFFDKLPNGMTAGGVNRLEISNDLKTGTMAVTKAWRSDSVTIADATFPVSVKVLSANTVSVSNEEIPSSHIAACTAIYTLSADGKTLSADYTYDVEEGAKGRETAALKRVE